jgi:hypothetical protein
LQCGFANFQEQGWVERICFERFSPMFSTEMPSSSVEVESELDGAKDFPAFEAEFYSCLDLRDDQNSIGDAYQKNHLKIVLF